MFCYFLLPAHLLYSHYWFGSTFVPLIDHGNKSERTSADHLNYLVKKWDLIPKIETENSIFVWIILRNPQNASQVRSDRQIRNYVNVETKLKGSFSRKRGNILLPWRAISFAYWYFPPSKMSMIHLTTYTLPTVCPLPLSSGSFW